MERMTNTIKALYLNLLCEEESVVYYLNIPTPGRVWRSDGGVGGWDKNKQIDYLLRRFEMGEGE